MDISQNSLSNEALWILYDRLLQQARQLEESLATTSNQLNATPPTDIPRRINPITPIRQTDSDGPGDNEDGDNSKVLEDDEATENDTTSSSLNPDERTVTITLSSSPAPFTPKKNPEVISISSGSTRTPPELRVPLQPVRKRFPPDLRNAPAIQTTRPQVLEPTDSERARRRIIIKRERVDEYRALVDAYMGVKYNIYTDDRLSPDTSDSSISEPEPIQSDVLSLLTVNAYVDAGVLESTAYDISNLGLATEGNYYIGPFNFEGDLQRDYARFDQSAWRELVSKVGALGADFNTAYSKVCDFLRTRRKLVAYAGVGRHATVLTLVRGSKVATYFDTWRTRTHEERALKLCSCLIKSVFNETTEGWTLQFPPVGRQNARANNCGLHSLLRVKDELEDNNQHDTDETSANTLRLYLALRAAYGEEKYPLADIIN